MAGSRPFARDAGQVVVPAGALVRPAVPGPDVRRARQWKFREARGPLFVRAPRRRPVPAPAGRGYRANRGRRAFAGRETRCKRSRPRTPTSCRRSSSRIRRPGMGRRANRTGRRAREVQEKGMAGIRDFQLTRWFTDPFRETHPELLERFAGWLTANDPAAFMASQRALGAGDLRDVVGKITCPTMVIVGEEDYATPPEMAQDLRDRIPRSEGRVWVGPAFQPRRAGGSVQRNGARVPRPRGIPRLVPELVRTSGLQTLRFGPGHQGIGKGRLERRPTEGGFGSRRPR